MHPAHLSLGMIKLPLPCSPSLWQAKSAIEWERQLELTRQPYRTASLRNLRSSIELLLPAHCDHSRQRRRGALVVFSASAFILQILIHGLASAIFEYKFRGVNSGCSPGIQALKLREFEEGLATWYSCFEHQNVTDHGATEILRSSLITYHVVSILLKESLSDIQMAAGIAYSWGRVVTPQRAQEAFLPLVSTQPVGKEAYEHALKVLSLCLIEVDQPKKVSSPQRPLHPLYLTYNAFISVVVLWGYALGLSRSQRHQHKSRDPIWTVQNGKLKLVNENESFGDSSDSKELGELLERGFAPSGVDLREVEGIRADVRRLMHIARNKLDENPWDLCK